MSENQDSHTEEDVRDMDRLVKELAAYPEKKRALLRKLIVEDTDALATLVGWKAMPAERGKPLVGCMELVSRSGISLKVTYHLHVPAIAGIPPFFSKTGLRLHTAVAGARPHRY